MVTLHGGGVRVPQLSDSAALNRALPIPVNAKRASGRRSGGPLLRCQSDSSGLRRLGVQTRWRQAAIVVSSSDATR